MFRWLKRLLPRGGYRYGDGDTHHQTRHVDVTMSPEGRVIAVSFRCAAMPFRVHHLPSKQAIDTALSMAKYPARDVVAVVFDEAPR